MTRTHVPGPGPAMTTMQAVASVWSAVACYLGQRLPGSDSDRDGDSGAAPSLLSYS